LQVSTRDNLSLLPLNALVLTRLANFYRKPEVNRAHTGLKDGM